MTATPDGGEAPKDVSESTGTDIIDAELADQLGELIEHIETVPWAQVPGLSATTAATFNRCLIEARSQLLLPRVITDGGRDVWSVADDEPSAIFYPGVPEYYEDNPTYEVDRVFHDPETTVVRLGIDAEWGEFAGYLHPEGARQLADWLLTAAEECEGE